MTRVGHALLTLVAAACLSVGCSGSTPRDKNYGTEAGADFVPPEAGAPDSGGDDGAAGAAGAGTAGAAGGTAGAAGSGQAGSQAGSDDGSTDSLSDGGAG